MNPAVFQRVKKVYKLKVCHSEERSDVGIRIRKYPILLKYSKNHNILENGLPHQRARWFAMTGFFDSLKHRRLNPAVFGVLWRKCMKHCNH